MFNNGGDQNLDEFTQELFSKLITATRISNNLPTEDEYQFYASFKPFKTKMNQLGKRLLDLTQNFLHHDENAKAPTINDSDDVDEVTEKFDEVVDFVDRLIEKVDLYAEEASGEKPKSNIVITKVTAPSRGGAKADYNIFHSTNLPKSQLQFPDTIDNTTAPFIPKITHKPNPLVPLDPLITQGQAYARASKAGNKAEAPNLGPGGFYPHPYEYELRSLQFLESQLTSRPEITYKSLEDTPYTWVDTLEGLQIIAAKLDKVDEIAIDLEAHAYRTFQGFVCLMQVSTRREDFIIDTLALRQHLHILNSSFTNPNIVKVLHGSDGDILWLQRDFGIYVVNLFDTGQASRVLEYPSFGLAYLLKFYCNVDADKKYQLADWRIRPLPEEMIKYAREDTHYLLYVYDRMRNELVSRGNSANNLLVSVLNRSRDLCLRRYEKERLDDTSHLMLYNKILPNHTTIFNALQMKVFAALYAWRDNIARVEDESTRYVLPNQIMFEIAAQMPADTSTLMSCCSPVPQHVRQHANDIIQLIKRAKDKHQALQQPQQSIISESPPMSRTFFPSSASSSFSSNSSFSSTGSSQSLHQIPHQQHHQPALKQNTLLDSPAPHHTTKVPETPTNGFSTHNNAPSPVLTTEQLYKTAGWLTEDDPEREPLKFTDDTPATPASPVTPRTRRRAILAKASTGVLFSAHSSSESDEEEDEAKRTAALIRSSFTSIVNASFPSFASIVVPSTSIPKPAAVPAKEEDEADGDDESETNADEEIASADEVVKPPAADGAQKKVPRSMAEIYKLSNQNRKRNKEKKKLKEDSLNTTHASPSSPVVLDENESSPVSRSKKQKTNHASKRDGDKDSERKDGEKEGDGEDTVQFMKEIGWITKTETKNSAQATPASNSSNNNNANSTSSSNVNFGNASGPGDVKSSASHTGKPHHSSSHPHSHSHSHPHSDSHDSMASSPPRNKSRQQQQQQQQPSPKQPARPHTQPHQHAQPPHHQSKPVPQHTGGKHSHPTTGHSGAPIPNFAAFDYNAAPNFNLVAPIGAPTPGQYYNAYSGHNQMANQTRVNQTNNNIVRRPPASATFRPTGGHHRT